MNATAAIRLINMERIRQQTMEKFDKSHDASHVDGELLKAGMCYYLLATHPDDLLITIDGVPSMWPWDPVWWKPKDRLRNLVRAGALMDAERNRLQSMGFSWTHVSQKWHLVIEAMCQEEPTVESTALNVPDMLTKLGDIHRERGKVYGDNYKHFGKIMALLFPKGLSLEKPIDYDRLAMLVHIQSKITRYAQNLMVNKTGHKDSLDDAAVYLMMLQELDSLWEAQNGKN